jgi:hypothetical protein
MKPFHSRHHWIVAALIALLAMLTLSEADGQPTDLNALVCAAPTSTT